MTTLSWKSNLKEFQRGVSTGSVTWLAFKITLQQMLVPIRVGYSRSQLPGHPITGALVRH